MLFGTGAISDPQSHVRAEADAGNKCLITAGPRAVLSSLGMRLLKTTAVVGSDIVNADTIEHEGKLWLVPHWLDTPDGQWQMPGRLVHPLTQAFQPFGTDRYVLSSPLPKELFAVRTPPQPVDGYEVQELPDIRIPRARS